VCAHERSGRSSLNVRRAPPHRLSAKGGSGVERSAARSMKQAVLLRLLGPHSHTDRSWWTDSGVGERRHCPVSRSTQRSENRTTARGSPSKEQIAADLSMRAPSGNAAGVRRSLDICPGLVAGSSDTVERRAGSWNGSSNDVLLARYTGWQCPSSANRRPRRKPVVHDDRSRKLRRLVDTLRWSADR